MRRNVLNSPRLLELKKHRHRAILKKFLIFGLGFLLFFILFVYLSRLPSLNISDLEIVGNKVIETAAIQANVKATIAGKYLWLFPKTNIFFYPKNKIKSELQDKFKRLKDINLSIKNTKILEVSLTERKALYTWCGATKRIETEQEKCYFLDEDGYIFDQAPYFSGEIYFKFYGQTGNLGGQAASDKPLGSYFFQQNFKQLVSFRDVLLGLKLKPVALSITNNNNMEIFLSRGAETSTEPKIILKTNANLQNAAENLKTALTTEPLQSEFKNKYSSLQYIDLRFENKVYSKFQ